MSTRGFLFAAVTAASLGGAACWNFEQAYDDCMATGRCTGDGGGGGDGGSGCANGLCPSSAYATTHHDGLNALWAVAPDSILFGGDETLMARWKGGTFSETIIFPGYQAPWISDLHGTSASDVWAVGINGLVLNFDGTQWNDANPSSLWENFYGVWSPSPGQALVAGSYGVRRFRPDGGYDELLTINGSAYLQGIWGSGSRAWAVGDDGTGKAIIYSADPNGPWPLEDAGMRVSSLRTLSAVHGSGPSDVWAVGSGGSVAHFDGGAWGPVDISSLDDLNDVWVTPDGGDVWITTFYTPKVYHRGPAGQWSSFVPPGADNVRIAQVQVTGNGDVWFVGSVGAADFPDGGVAAHYTTY